MSYYLNFLILSLIICAFILSVWALFSFKRNNIKLKDYIKSDKGQSAIKSALTAIVVIIVGSLILFMIPNNANADNPFEGGSFLNEAGVYIGLDYTNGASPQCEEDFADNRGTSNLGFYGNLWRDKTGTVDVNFKTTHHSCFLGEDRNTYDAFSGLELRWTVFKRKK